MNQSGADLGGRCKGFAPSPPSPPSDDLRFSNTTGILPKKTMWFISVEVEQETSASHPKKNPGSAPANVPVFQMFTELVEYCVLFFFPKPDCLG